MRERGREGPKHYTQNDYKGLGEGGLWGPSLRPSMCSLAHCDVQSEHQRGFSSFLSCLSHSISSLREGTVLCLPHTSSPSTMLMVPNVRINWSANRFLPLFSLFDYILSFFRIILKGFVTSLDRESFTDPINREGRPARKGNGFSLGPAHFVWLWDLPVRSS